MLRPRTLRSFPWAFLAVVNRKEEKIMRRAYSENSLDFQRQKENSGKQT